MNARLNLKWEIVGTEAVGSCCPIPRYRCELGTDEEGDTWFCEARYRYYEKKYLVRFDYETEEQSAFLKSEVLDADNYWRKHDEVYHAKWVGYEDIEKVIREFIIYMGIDHKDVTGKLVTA